MRPFAVAVVVGLAALAFEVWLAFSVWLLPMLVDAANALALIVALVALGVCVWKKRHRARAAAVALAFALPMLEIPIAAAVADSRVHAAQRYCEHPSAAARPVLLRPGYSVRYPPRVEATACTFPDPFPGRTFWQGEARRDGTWTWEHAMD